MINTEKFNSIVEAAKAKAANDPKWLRAIEKAAKAILSGEMIVTTLAHGALVTTAGGTYTANGICSCPARTKHCYHRAGARLMAIYEETATPVVSARETIIADIKSTWPKTWPPLAVELMARFRCNSLNFLDDDMLRRVRLAIAM